MSIRKAKKRFCVAPVSVRDKLLSYAFWLIGRRDYSEKEMRRKLDTKIKLAGGSVTSPTQTDEILEVLKRYNYIDDEKFARMYVTNRTSVNPRGRYLVWKELSLKGISRDIFDKIWDEMKVDEREVAMEFLSRKRKVLSRYEGRKRKEKVAALLAGRGFSGDIVWDLASDFEALSQKAFSFLDNKDDDIYQEFYNKK